MIHSTITTTTNDVPKLYEEGWEWWAWPTNWIALAVIGFVIALSLPLALKIYRSTMDRAAKSALLVLCIAVSLAAVVMGWLGPGILMRHMDNGQGAFWVFLGCLTLGGLVWFWSGRILEATADPYYDWTGRYSPWEGHAGKMAAAPAVVIGAGTIFGGIAEIVTRLAASIPMGIAQFLGLAGSVLTLGLIWLVAQFLRQRV